MITSLIKLMRKRKINGLRFFLAVACILGSQLLIWNLFQSFSTCQRTFSLYRHKLYDMPCTKCEDERLKEEKAARLIQSPTNIYVLGERNSGTSYTSRGKFLKNAFDPPNKPDQTRPHEFFSSDIPVLRHKHMFRHFLLNETELEMISSRTDILWILVVRGPCEWAEAMKRIPWHMCPPKSTELDCTKRKFIGFEGKTLMEEYKLEEFFQLPWGDWPECVNFRNLSFVSNDFVYRNVFQLRRHKLMLMKQIIETVPRNVKIVRLHELERSPEIFIQNIILEFNMTLKKGYKTQPPSPKIHAEKCLSFTEWQIAQREIDWRIENEFGFTYLDCHLCY